MQNNEFQTLSQGYYAKLLIYFDLGSGQIRRIRVIYEVAQNVICSDSMCNEYCKIILRESYVYFYFALMSNNAYIAIVMYKSYLFTIMASWTVANSQTSRDEVILNIYYDQCRNRTDNLKLKSNLKHTIYIHTKISCNNLSLQDIV